MPSYSKGDSSAFSLSLANEMSWGFRANPFLYTWLEEFAHILTLRQNQPSSNANIEILKTDQIKHIGVSKSEIDLSIRVGSALQLDISKDYHSGWIYLDSEFINQPDIRYISMIWALRPVQLHELMNGGGPFHAMLAELDGKGVLITGSSGSGKSTCYQRLPEHWIPLCDDQVLLVKGAQGGYYAHPFPTWSEYIGRRSDMNWNSSQGVPIHAIFLLYQNNKDSVNELPRHVSSQALYDAHQQLWERFTVRIDEQIASFHRHVAFENACNIAKKIPCYTLEASIQGRFWELIEKELGYL